MSKTKILIYILRIAYLNNYICDNLYRGCTSQNIHFQLATYIIIIILIRYSGGEIYPLEPILYGIHNSHKLVYTAFITDPK